MARQTDLRPGLAHVRRRVLYGPVAGNCHVIVDAVAKAAAKRRGAIESVASAGSTETLGSPRGIFCATRLAVHVLRVLGDLEALAARSLKLPLSPLVPTGGETVNRYQESLIHETLAVLRAVHDRWHAARSLDHPMT